LEINAKGAFVEYCFIRRRAQSVIKSYFKLSYFQIGVNGKISKFFFFLKGQKKKLIKKKKRSKGKNKK